MRHEIWLSKEHLESILQGGEVTFQTHVEMEENEPITICLGSKPEINSFGDKEICPYPVKCLNCSEWCGVRTRFKKKNVGGEI